MSTYRDERSRLIIPANPNTRSVVLTLLVIVCGLCWAHGTDEDTGKPMFRDPRPASAVTLALAFPFFAWMRRRTVFDRDSGVVEIESFYGPPLMRWASARALVQLEACMGGTHVEYGDETPTTMHDVVLKWRGGWPDTRIFSSSDAQAAAAMLALVSGYLAPRMVRASGTSSPGPVVLPTRVRAHVLLVDAASGSCGVCGTGMREGCVACPRCETPHHSDCWSYNGGCAVYACGVRR